MTQEEKRAVEVTHKAVARFGSDAQRFIDAGHKIVHMGAWEFRCVVCGKRAMSDSDLTPLDQRCK